MARPEIRALTAADRDAALAVINAAARWYRDFLPAEEFHDPEMTPAQWEAEAQRMAWYGAFIEGALVGVMGLEYVKDAALLRHAYVLAEYQREGIGTRLREHLEAQVRGVRRIIVGTYRENYKARRMLERAGYTLSPDPEAVLRTYYSIPDRPPEILGHVREVPLTPRPIPRTPHAVPYFTSKNFSLGAPHTGHRSGAPPVTV